jgi:hypothetical protein
LESEIILEQVWRIIERVLELIYKREIIAEGVLELNYEGEITPDGVSG